MKTAIISYGLGNLASVYKALDSLGANPFIVESPAGLREADRIVLPGVGAFSDGMKCLSDKGWIEGINETVVIEKKPLLGICLGMQMLATVGNEGGVHEGLSLIPGEVKHLTKLGCGLRVPHVGWNDVNYKEGSPLFMHIPQKSDFYFVHSFAFVPDNVDHVLAATSYDIDITAVVGHKCIMGCQFHPEKSSKAGLQLLRNFLELSPC